MPYDWTPERVDLARQLWRDGVSASIIAARLPDTVSRNAVIGKMHRIGEGKRSTPTRVVSVRRPYSRRAPTGARKLAHAQTYFPTPPGEALTPEPFTPSAEIEPIPLDQRKGILDLKDNDCRWPIGDPKDDDFHFCGRATVPGLPYCTHHVTKAFEVRPAASRHIRRAAA